MKQLIVISGNIGAGKSTYLSQFVDFLQARVEKEVILVEEGIESDPLFKEKLERFYENPDNRIDFQQYITDFRHRRLKEYPDDAILVSERGLMDDIVFSNATSPDLETVDGKYVTYYYDLLRRLREDYPKVLANIYLRTNPEACARNIRQRNRPSEENITPLYLNTLHHCHEAFLPMVADKFQYPLITRDYGNHTDRSELSEDIFKELSGYL